MIPTISNRMFLVTVAAVALVGAVDAAAGDSWDLALLFAAVAVLHLGMLARTALGRPEVRVRADLVRWMRDRADVGGERVEDVADRAISTYRAGLLGADPDGVQGGDPEASPPPGGGTSGDRAEPR